VIAVDTNILVYAHRKDLPFHEIAKAAVAGLAASPAAWAIA
jgi:predicted nucleic acid-binding protein